MVSRRQKAHREKNLTDYVAGLIAQRPRVLDIDELFATVYGARREPNTFVVYSAVRKLAPHRVVFPAMHPNTRQEVEAFQREIMDYADQICQDRVIVDYEQAMLVWCASETDAVLMKLRFG